MLSNYSNHDNIRIYYQRILFGLNGSKGTLTLMKMTRKLKLSYKNAIGRNFVWRHAFLKRVRQSVKLQLHVTQVDHLAILSFRKQLCLPTVN